MTLYFSKLHEVVEAPVGHQTTSVWLSSSECSTEGKVYYVRLPCIFGIATVSRFHYAVKTTQPSQSSSSQSKIHDEHASSRDVPMCNCVNMYMIRYHVYTHASK